MKKFFTNLFNSDQNNNIKKGVNATPIENSDNISPQLPFDSQKYITTIEIKTSANFLSQYPFNFVIPETDTKPNIVNIINNIPINHQLTHNQGYFNQLPFDIDNNRNLQKPTQNLIKEFYETSKIVSDGPRHIRKTVTPSIFRNEENKTDLSMLPPLIWSAIFLDLSGNDNRNLMGVCRFFASLISNDKKLLEKVNHESMLFIDKRFVMR